MKDLVMQYKQTKNVSTRNELILACYNVIDKIARKYSNGDVELHHELKVVIMEDFSKYIEKFDSDKGFTFYAYFSKCAAHRCCRFLRERYEKFDFDALEDCTDDDRHHAPDHATSEIVERALQYLQTETPERVRAFFAVHIQAESIKGLSDITGTPVNTIRSKADNVLENVRKFVNRR